MDEANDCRMDRVTNKFSPKVKEALDSGSDLKIVQMLLDLLQLSYRTLTPFAPKHKGNHADKDLNHDDPIGTEAGGSRTHRAVVNLVRQELTGKAMQRLMSRLCRQHHGPYGSCEKCIRSVRVSCVNMNHQFPKCMLQPRKPRDTYTNLLPVTNLARECLDGLALCCCR